MERRPDRLVIVLTATGGVDTVVKAMQAGATDFFIAPASPSGSPSRSATPCRWAT